MSAQMVNLSETVRDMKNEICICRISPSDAEKLRNAFQAVIRDLMSLKHETVLFNNMRTDESHLDVVVQVDDSDTLDDSESTNSEDSEHIRIVQDLMAGPTRNLIGTMSSMLRICNTVLMRTLGAPELSLSTAETDLERCLLELQDVIQEYDTADKEIAGHPGLPSSYASDLELVEIFLFMHPVRQAANTVLNLGSRVFDITSNPKNGRRRLFLPSFPLRKAIQRVNPQVQHDRGGIIASSYFRSKNELDTIMDKVHAKAYVLHPDRAGDAELTKKTAATGFLTADENTLRYKTWKVLHRLQQFETRFALKVVFVMVLLSLPAWLHESRDWWYEHESWWALVAAWFMMHPRVGGNATDLVSRTISAASGAAYGGLSYWAASASGAGLPYVLGCFAAVFMLPASMCFTSRS
jgi:hypothetical protein